MSQTMTLATQESLNRWARRVLPQISGVDDPALALTLEHLAAATTTTTNDDGDGDDAGDDGTVTRRENGRRRGATAASARGGGRAMAECVERMNVREMTNAMRRQTSKVDGSAFEDVPEDVGRLALGEVWAKVSGGSFGASDRGRGEDGIGVDGGDRMLSLPRLSSLTFLQLTEAIAAEPMNAAEEENRGVAARGKRGERTGGTAATRSTKSASGMRKSGRGATGMKSGTKRRATGVALVEVETVPGVSYEPKKLKVRSGVPTPATRRAIAPRKMGRRPKDAPEETESEKRMRAEERLFRNRESAARSREKKQNAMKALEDENERLRAENRKLRTKLAKLEKELGAR